MNQSDTQVEKVLRGLRDVEPDASLQQRITWALRKQSEHRAESLPWLRLSPWRLAGAAVACIAILTVVMTLPHKNAVEQHQLRSDAPQALLPNAPANAKPSSAFVSRRGSMATAARPHLQPAETPHDIARVETSAASSSVPAPPMPLTEQERLLIRLAHHDDPVQLAQLSSARREVRYEQEKQKVSDFFMVFAPPDATWMESEGGTQ
jgi:hypothetical protein